MRIYQVNRTIKPLIDTANGKEYFTVELAAKYLKVRKDRVLTLMRTGVLEWEMYNPFGNVTVKRLKAEVVHRYGVERNKAASSSVAVGAFGTTGGTITYKIKVSPDHLPIVEDFLRELNIDLVKAYPYDPGRAKKYRKKKENKP